MMHFEPGNQYISYKHVEANDPKQLEIKMLQIQITTGKPVNFTPPMYNAKTNMYESWFLHDFSKDIKPKKKLNMNNKVSLEGNS